MNTTISPEGQPTIDVTIQLPVKMMDILHDIVTTKKDVDISTLVSRYISSGIERDLPETHRKCFANHVKEILKKHNVPSEAIAEIDDKFSY